MFIDFRVRGGKEPVVEALNVTENGTYTPPEGIDGYSPVVVSVSADKPVLYMKDFPGLKFAQYSGKTIPDNVILDGIVDGNHMFYESRIETIPEFDSSQCTNMAYMFQSSIVKKMGKLDVSKVTSLDSFLTGSSIEEIHFTGGMLPDCNMGYSSFLNGIAPSGTFFYDLPGDYSPALKKLNLNWSSQPLGSVPLEIRILKDGAWLSGDLNLTINGEKLEYAGKGLYKITEEITKENYLTKNTELQLDGVKIGDVKWNVGEQSILAGDNSSVHKEYVGQAILDLAAENDGWTYKEEYQAVVSKDIAHSGRTFIKFPFAGKFEILYGQKSEAGYDYCQVFNSDNIEIWNAKGARTEIGQEKTATITTDTTATFTYKKDGSGTQEPDCFWLKKISFTDFPPYPEV